MSTTPQELTEFDEVQAGVTELVKPALTIQVKDAVSAQAAVDAGKQIKMLSLRIEKVRDSLVRPLNTRVKEVNAYAQRIEAPLTQAERHIKAQLVAWEVEQEEKRKAEQRRIEAERQQAEALLRIKQEQERQAIEAGSEWGAESEDTERERLALEEKHAQEAARLRGQVQAKIFDSERNGVKNARKVWDFDVVDLSLIPRQYLKVEVNRTAILAAARGGITEIPGVKLYQKTTVAFGANTYVPEALPAWEDE